MDKTELKEKTKAVVTHTITEIKSSSKSIKIMLVVCMIALAGLGYLYYKQYTRNVELDALKQENIQIKNRMNAIDSNMAKINFQYLDIQNKVSQIDTDLKAKLKEAKEVVIDEVKTSSDIVSVLDGLSDLTTGK